MTDLGSSHNNRWTINCEKMSFGISPPPPMVASKDGSHSPMQTSPSRLRLEEEWVEIIEPKSKTKIYANLDSGVCAKSPPEGVSVLKDDDFDDRWWELYDKNTGKYYYYNPDQQKTVWTRPTTDPSVPTNGSNIGHSARKRVLIIPVSKLQTSKKITSTSEQNHHNQTTKCDASTQTVSSNLITTGTQTFSENELCEGITALDICNNNPSSQQPQAQTQAQKTSTYRPRISSKIAEYQNAFKSSQDTTTNHRTFQELKRNNKNSCDTEASQSSSKNVESSLSTQSSEKNEPYHNNQNKSSRIGLVGKKIHTSFDTATSAPDRGKDASVAHDYFSPTPPQPSISYKQQYRRSINLRDNPLVPSFRSDESSRSGTTISTSTFKKSATISAESSSAQSHDARSRAKVDQKNSSQSDHNQLNISDAKQQHSSQPVVTNNLSHYLVREARAMGIALISDDELEDDDHESDDEFVNEDDEETDIRDDLSSTKDLTNDIHASQDLGELSSEGGRRSVSDHESPISRCSPKHPKMSSIVRGSRNVKSLPRKEPQATRSPITCETNTTTFRYDNNELIDDQKDPAAGKSQQLDHQKLVENFKKTRQTSALGFNDSLSRSYRLDANNAVQRLKTVADTYFSNSASPAVSEANPVQERDIYKANEKYLRHLSTLSTLPRPMKAKPPQVPKDADLDLDADYDLVEENCSYYSNSDSRQTIQDNQMATHLDTSNDPSIYRSVVNQDNPSPVTNYFDRNKSTRGSTFSVESFARENLSRHQKKGGLIFNRKVKWSRMISWTKNSIKQPMISSVSSDLTADSINCFKIIQQYMGDRKITISKRYRQLLTQSGLTEQEISSMTHRKSLGRTGSLGGQNALNNSSTNVANNSAEQAANYVPDRLRDELAFELAVKGCVNSSLRDEIFVQLARQLTENPCTDSTSWGLVLMSILLSYYSPSSKFAPFLLSFLESHAHQMARDVCLPRLEKRLRQNWPTYCRKPADGKEISIVRLSITKWPQYCGVFGESLEHIMTLQACSPHLKTLRLPWILTTLGDKLLETGGAETEGIFRCAADHDLLAQLRLEIDCIDFRKITDANQLKSLLSNVDDPHVIACLLKLFFRQLSEPVFPARLYDACLLSCQDAAMACRLFNERLPNLNKDVVAYLTRLLQLLSEKDKVINTKMDTANLSMVWAPNLLRAPSNFNESMTNLSKGDSRSGSKWSISNATGDEQAQQHQNPPPLSQSLIFEQTRQEMQFIKLLIQNLDTTFIEKVV